MSTTVSCPHCQHLGRVPDNALSAQVRCPHCRRSFVPSANIVLADGLPFAPVVEAPREEPGGFRCPYCRTSYPPRMANKVSAAGWVLFVVLILSVCGLPLCWLALFITEDYRVCSSCGIKLG